MKRFACVLIVFILLLGCSPAAVDDVAMPDPSEEPAAAEAVAVPAVAENNGTHISWSMNPELSVVENVKDYVKTFGITSEYESADDVMAFSQNANAALTGYKESVFEDGILIVYIEFDDLDTASEPYDKLSQSTAQMGQGLHDLMITCGKGNIPVSCCVTNLAASDSPIYATVNNMVVYVAW